MGTSSNFGNMLSMAMASLVLPFLPLLPVQILLNNLFYDTSEIGIPFDNVDGEDLRRPRAWDLGEILRFTLVMGSVSSAFDLLTFTVLLTVFHADPDSFRTAWFIESLLTELVIALVVRTRRRFYQSKPGGVLLWSTVALAALTYSIPFLPFSSILGFVPISLPMLAAITAITALYVLAAEIAKRWFYRSSNV
jgi:Mg2+-importing ATPase